MILATVSTHMAFENFTLLQIHVDEPLIGRRESPVSERDDADRERRSEPVYDPEEDESSGGRGKLIALGVFALFVVGSALVAKRRFGSDSEQTSVADYDSEPIVEDV